MEMEIDDRDKDIHIRIEYHLLTNSYPDSQSTGNFGLSNFTVAEQMGYSIRTSRANRHWDDRTNIISYNRNEGNNKEKKRIE